MQLSEDFLHVLCIANLLQRLLDVGAVEPEHTFAAEPFNYLWQLDVQVSQRFIQEPLRGCLQLLTSELRETFNSLQSSLNLLNVILQILWIHLDPLQDTALALEITLKGVLDMT